MPSNYPACHFNRCEYNAFKSFTKMLLLAIAIFPGSAVAIEIQTPIVAMGANPELRATLLDALDEKGADYQPRTEHLFDDGSPVYTNRLILEASPYLIQHAHNPVNWYPWGKTAFTEAAKQNKPIFLSIGYATCHWCHVMERESFESISTAEFLNKNFISIKVDREQLPDIDALYMSAVMMIAGSGGWPMSTWLDSEGRPFFGGTYFPPDHFLQLLNRIDQLWRTDKPALLEQATQVANAMRRMNDTSAVARTVGLADISGALTEALHSHDAENGGFGEAPKFPRESTLFFLLNEAERHADSEALSTASSTLEKMAAGGIHDHIAGGFHRYAVDSKWLVPHFEKMLYNQAALARNYSQAWALTGNSQHARTASRILDYVLREMRSDEGLFFSATDADSEGEEGLFFVWTPEELEEVLGRDEASTAKQVWNVTGEGNFEGHSILHLSAPLPVLAKRLDSSVEDLLNKMDHWANRLLIQRQDREKPLLDSKVLTSWNGMMITALTEGGERLNESRYLEAAIYGAATLWEKMFARTGQLQRSYFEGRSSIAGTQPDYAYFAEALIALFDATGERDWLDKAVLLSDEMHDQFWDTESGGYFMGSASVAGTALAVRPKDIHDNSIPAGNSVAMRVQAKLYKRTGEQRFETRADELIAALSSQLDQSPSGFFYFLLGASEHLQGETGPLQYAARGNVRAQISKHNADLLVRLELTPGWHINSNTPIQDYLIPTELQTSNGSPVPNTVYPKPILQGLSFDNSALSLFDGSVDIRAQHPVDNGNSNPFHLQLQACNDTHCLPPETIKLRLPVSALAEN